jgi:hypothetical protein
VTPVRLSPLLLPLVLLIAASAACGGEGDRSASIIHRLLIAAGTETSGELRSFVGRLPEGLPVTPPQYPGAKVVVSSRQLAPVGDLALQDDPAQDAPQPVLFFIVLDTGDGREDVFDYYEDALDEDPWELEASFSAEELDTLQFSNLEDADISGVVSVASGGEDRRTSILISLQDAGGLLDEAAPFVLGKSLPLPKEFPPDVPLYRGATVTATAFLREPANQSFLLTFLTTDSQDDVIEFYRGEFQAHGWTVLAGAPFGLEERIDFRDDGRDIQGQVLADRFPRDRRFTEVRIQVQLDPARTPATDGDGDGGATPTPAPTAQEDGGGGPASG